MNGGNTWESSVSILKHKKSELVFVGDGCKVGKRASPKKGCCGLAELSGISGLVKEEEEGVSKSTPNPSKSRCVNRVPRAGRQPVPTARELQPAFWAFLGYEHFYEFSLLLSPISFYATAKIPLLIFRTP